MSGIACLFPGQGAQYVGMAHDLYTTYGFVRELYDELSEQLHFDLAATTFEGDEETLARTSVCQPAIFAASLAALDVARERGCLPEQPVGTAGLSLGEYTALCYSGAAPRAAVARIVAIRGRAMQEACESEPGAMASVLTSDAALVERVVAELAAAGQVVAVSNYNSPKQLVISGAATAVANATEQLKEQGVRRVIPLKVAGAYHSPLMQPAVDALLPELEALEIVTPQIPLVMNASGQTETDPARIRKLLEQQVCLAVRWVASMQTLQDLGMQSALELGPGTVLAGLLRGVDRRLKVTSLCTLESFDGLPVSS